MRLKNYSQIFTKLGTKNLAKFGIKWISLIGLVISAGTGCSNNTDQEEGRVLPGTTEATEGQEISEKTPEEQEKERAEFEKTDVAEPALAETVQPSEGQGPENAERWGVKENGVLLDTLSGLQWTQRDNLRNIKWNGAKAYCKALSLAGGGWRLPTLEEFKQVYMYDPAGGTPCGSWEGENITCQVSSLFHLTAGWFWSSDQGTYASEAWAYDLGFGTSFSILASSPDGNRALCVRQAGVLTDQEEPRDLANSEDARKLRGQLCIYLRQLIEFKDEENFRKFGFGIGGPYNNWLKNVEALGASYPKGLNHPTLPFELRVATGELLMLGHKYVQRDSEYTNSMLPEIKKTIDFRNCR